MAEIALADANIPVNGSDDDSHSFSDHPTRLHYVGPDVVETGIDLLADKRRWHFVDAMDTLSVLCRECRRGRHGITAMCGNDLLICLEAPET
jgi:hypothetical protein